MKRNATKRNIRILAMALALSAVSAGTLYADDGEITADVSIGAEWMGGHTTYRIGYPVTIIGGPTEEGYFPFSELKWPLDT
ncbi:MAG: hypothetical protein FJZ79_06825 [Chlorobi bacterium]|nr:hypothetical protein [Chlorobiota bacterium]